VSVRVNRWLALWIHSKASGTLAQPYVIGQKLNQIDRPLTGKVVVT
jgi:hypothetical protein